MTPKTKVKIFGKYQSVFVDAIVDTGFDGDLSLPIPVAVNLGLELIGTDFFEYADGREKEELVFAGRARLAGKTRKVRILLCDSEDTLIGTRLLSDCRLRIDINTGTVQIARRK